MIETIILPAYPLLDYAARLLDHVLGREPTYGEVANYLAYRFMETAMLPVLPTNTLLSKEVLSLSILDHRVYEAYIFTAYSFNLHGCVGSLELLVYDYGLVFTEPGAQHVAREKYHSPVPRARYLCQTIAFTPPRIDCSSRAWERLIG